MLDVQQVYRYCVTTLLSLWQMQWFFEFQNCLEAVSYTHLTLPTKA